MTSAAVITNMEFRWKNLVSVSQTHSWQTRQSQLQTTVKHDTIQYVQIQTEFIQRDLQIIRGR